MNADRCVDDRQSIDEPNNEDYGEDDLKKEDIKMAQDPLGCDIIPITNFVHEILERHLSSVSGAILVLY